MRRKWTSYCICLLFFFMAPMMQSVAQIDSQYIQQLQRKNFILPYVGIFSRSLQFSAKQQQYSLRFSPNSSGFVGLSGAYKKLHLTIELPIPGTYKINNISGVNAIGKFIHFFGSKWGLTTFASYNTGMLMHAPDMQMYQKREDLKMFSAGAYVYRIFNHRHFSYLAASSMSRQQLKSSGSFIVMAIPSYRQLFSKAAVIPDALEKFHFNGGQQGVNALRFISLQGRVGYIHNFVWKKGVYFFSPSLYAGPGIEWHTYASSKGTSNGFNMAATWRCKMVAGINGAKYFGSIELLRDRVTTFLQQTNIKNTYSEASLNIGVRF
jgi:hypothetical protein